MSFRAAWLAWSLWALSVALTALSLILLVLNLSHPDVHVYDYWLENTLSAVLFSTVGAIVASRRAENSVGWLFNPLRRYIQSFIYRRFYRNKYDARKTREAFSAKLRDETDIDALNSELLSTVRETMQPEHASLRLREPERKVER
jgi:hypothetical protein